jgi:hypothetical protein
MSKQASPLTSTPWLASRSGPRRPSYLRRERTRPTIASEVIEPGPPIADTAGEAPAHRVSCVRPDDRSPPQRIEAQCMPECAERSPDHEHRRCDAPDRWHQQAQSHDRADGGPAHGPLSSDAAEWLAQEGDRDDRADERRPARPDISERRRCDAVQRAHQHADRNQHDGEGGDPSEPGRPASPQATQLARHRASWRRPDPRRGTAPAGLSHTFGWRGERPSACQPP